MSKKMIKRIGITFFSILILVGIVYDYHENKYNILPSDVEKFIEEKKKNHYKKEEILEEFDSVNLSDIRIKYNNLNIHGRIEIPDLQIDSWITREADNEYYLSHNLLNESDLLGNPFFDYRNQDLLNDRQINIYGHNTNDKNHVQKLPFINLEAYVENDIFKNYKDVYLSIDNKKIHYEVVAVKVITNKNNEHMKLEFSNDREYINHLNQLFEDTLYKDDVVNISSDMHLLVLQICHYNPKNTYLLIICQKM